MSKTIAIRVSDEVHSALAAQCLASGQTMTELVLPHILGLIELPPAPASLLEDRVMALETQLTQHKKCLDGCAAELLGCYARLDVLEDAASHLDHCFYQDTDSSAVTEISAEPEPIEDKRSPVSSRDSGEAGTSAPEFDRYAVPILKPHSSGGYYFRFEDIEQPGLKGTIQTQAKLMGFSSQAVKIEGKATRVWLNREYCL